MEKLFLLSLPIGNLGDLSERGRKILEEKEIFAVEDTRKFRDTCRRLEVSLEGKTVVSFHDQSTDFELERVLENLEHHDIVFCSDAGSPIVSDPGFPLVKKALEKGGELETIPGVSAVLAALELSGLPPHPYTFMGFFPREKKSRTEICDKIARDGQTWIFFESPHRVVDCLDFLAENLPAAQVAVCRELTKTYQQVERFLLGDWEAKKSDLVAKGEFVICLYSEPSGQVSDSHLSELAQQALDKGGKPKLVAKLIASVLGLSTKEVYERLNR